VKQPELRIRVSKQAMAMLRSLAARGLYGRGIAGVARGFLYAELRRFLVETGEVGRRKA
jgi:hypothetical protein